MNAYGDEEKLIKMTDSLIQIASEAWRFRNSFIKMTTKLERKTIISTEKYIERCWMMITADIMSNIRKNVTELYQR